MDKETAIRCVKQYADLVKRNFKVKKIILYGSCLKEGAVRIDEKYSIPVKRGIARMEANELVILVEK